MSPVRMPAMALATKVRLGFAVVAGLYAALTGTFQDALPWILLVVVLDLGATGVSVVEVELPIRRGFVIWLMIGLCAIGAGLAFTTVGPAVAPLAFIPAYHAGLLHGRLGFLVATSACAASSLVVLIAGGGLFIADVDVNDFLLWTATTLLLGGLGAWSLRLSGGDSPQEPPEAREARALLHRLHELSVEHGTELDAPARASLLLERATTTVAADRGVVLGREQFGALVPLAFHGSRRIDPGMVPGDALPEELSRGPARHMTHSDDLGERSVLVVPIARGTEPAIGALVLDRSASTPFDDDDVAVVSALTRAAMTDLEVALLFSSLRTMAAVEERNRLANEMHDGIAQDLAALGFQIDAVRVASRRSAAPITSALDELRSDLGTVISGLRSRISDLHMTQRPERSLGALLSATTQAFGTNAGIATTVTVHEGQVRLPPHVEAALLKIALDVLEHARRSEAQSASVVAELSGRQRSVRVTHDGMLDAPMPRLGRHLHGLRQIEIEQGVDAKGGTMVTSRVLDPVPAQPRPSEALAPSTSPSTSSPTTSTPGGAA